MLKFLTALPIVLLLALPAVADQAAADMYKAYCVSADKGTSSQSNACASAQGSAWSAQFKVGSRYATAYAAGWRGPNQVSASKALGSATSSYYEGGVWQTDGVNAGIAAAGQENDGDFWYARLDWADAVMCYQSSLTDSGSCGQDYGTGIGYYNDATYYYGVVDSLLTAAGY
jgi:hypothetical protein